MRGWGKILVATAATTAVLFAVTLNGSLQVLGTLTASIVDFTASTSTAPMKTGTSLPGTCATGQAFFKTDAAAGQNIYLCTAANTWTQVQGGGGGSASSRPSTRYIVAQTDFGGVSWSQSTPVYLGSFLFSRLAGSQNLNNPTAGVLPADRSGMATISTTTTTDNYSSWALNIAATGISLPFVSDGESFYARTDLDWEVVYLFRLTSTTDQEFLSGLYNQSTSNPPHAIGLSYRAASSSNFQWTVTGDNSWVSDFDTGMAADTNWHKVKIRSDGTQAYKIWMSLDNGTEVSVCPSGCNITRGSSDARLLSAIGFYLKTKAAEQKSVQLDYAHFYLDRGVER